MTQVLAGRAVWWAALALFVALAFPAFERMAGAAEPTAKKTTVKRMRGRLPPHYRTVVSEEQRSIIYQIQEEYRVKIEALEAQLEAIKKERKEKIAAVLTPEQKKQVAEAAAIAKAGTPPIAPAETPTTPKADK
jgi:hypothetical protein